MDGDRIARLSEGQRECLRMVLHPMSSKEIARALGISRHTVDQRLRLAMRTLDVANRIEAARALAAHEGAEGYQRSAYQPPHIDPAGLASPAAASATREAGHEERLRRLGWIMAIAAAAAVLLAAIFIGLNALSEFTR
jgi:DNA-binding CsgD family transcriptional regulator